MATSRATSAVNVLLSPFGPMPALSLCENSGCTLRESELCSRALARASSAKVMLGMLSGW